MSGRFGAITGVGGVVIRRRARRDVGLLATVVALVATSTLLAVVGPALVLETIDGGARDTVEAAGSRGDVTLSGAKESSGALAGAAGQLAWLDTLTTLSKDVPGRLPDGLAQVSDGVTFTVLGAPAEVAAVNGEPVAVAPGGAEDLAMRIGMLTPENTEGLEVVEGRLPEPRAATDSSPVEVVISTGTVEATELGVGDAISAIVTGERAALEANAQPVSGFEVVGVFERAPTGTDVWQDMIDVWEPHQLAATVAGPAAQNMTVLAAPDGVAQAEIGLLDPFGARYRVRVDAAAFTSELASQVSAEIGELDANASTLAGDSGVAIDVSTGLAAALAAYPPQERAALAQMSVLVAGVIGIAGVVVVLLGRLLVNYRAGALALERARGASVASIGARAIVESFIVAVSGVAIGLGVSWIVLREPARDLLPVIAVALVAILAAPVQAMLLARAVWTGRREPANRHDRLAIVNRARVRRLVIEATVIALAVGAVVSLRGRGLLQTRTTGIDPFLAVAPLLLGLAVTVVVLRAYPWPVLAVGSVARRSRGVLGLLGAVRSQQAVAVLPLLALTLGAALAVSGGMLVDTVRSGQEAASWQRVGADVRIDTEVSAADVAALRAAPGVTAVAAAEVRGNVGLDLGTNNRNVTVIAVDEGFADVIDRLPDAPSTENLRALSSVAAASDRLPAVVDAQTANRLIGSEIGMYYGSKYLLAEVVGTTAYEPRGFIDGPYLYVDLASVLALMPEAFDANTVLVSGPGAADAALALGLPAESMLTRADWIDARRDLALIGGVETTMVAAVIAAALLAVVALVAMVVSGARSRGRALSMLRTLGVSSRVGWWLALAELAPLVIAAVLGGAVAGVVVVASLAPSLGLDVLAGGLEIPTPSISPIVIVCLVAAAGVLLLLGALADVVVHRRDKLSEVLRFGDTI